MEGQTSSWNNPDAGMHPLPDDPREIMASVHAAARCMARFPYLGVRFGERGDAFARTDSGYLATLVRFPGAYVARQVQWLARVLSSRGMPGWLMEVHLEVLAEELANTMPSNQNDHGKLLDAAAVLGAERRSIVPQADFDRLAARFALQSGDFIANFGGLLVSAVCDEARGVERALFSITSWVESCHDFPREWHLAVADLIHQSQRIARSSTC